MYEGKRVVVLIAAAGSGQRMGSSTPKQFLNIGDKTLLEKSTEAFSDNVSVDVIYIISSKDHIDGIDLSPFPKVKKVIEGGSTRQESVYNGLESIEDADIVLIHDAARPHVNQRVIDAVIKAVYKDHAVIPAISVADTIKIVNNNYIEDTPNRNELFAAQTPQGFDFDLIKNAHEKAKQDNFTGTDDAQLLERLSHRVYIVPGDEENIKITTPKDMPLEDMKVGLGFDVHAFADDRDLILGGINIPYEKGLLGHSDADVLTHALMDAILGALNLGDIGTNFPDTDSRYKDIRSTLLLEKVNGLMKEKGYTLENADLIIVAEKPKMKGHTLKMRENLASVLDIDPGRISIKATTTEGLGFTGREEGIGAQAIIQLIKVKDIV